jgi:predicted DNA-binding protein
LPLVATAWLHKCSILGSLVSRYRGILIPVARMSNRKNMTLRLPAEQADELEAVARAEGISVSDAVREAISDHIERKRKDKAFRERLREVMERDREILERLAR